LSGSWADRLNDYLSDFQKVVQQLQEAVETSRLQTSDMDANRLPESQATFRTLLEALERKVAQRAELLSAADAPSEGATLTEKVLRSNDKKIRVLADRCRELSSEISVLNQRAVSLFVCQYHLAQLGGEIIRALSGHAGPITYRAQGRPEPKPPAGGLFNEAA
jgi:flagellar biosynthesis/type III secretory pathway chaperone